MKHIFKPGAEVEIHLSNGNQINGKVHLVSEEYVQLVEDRVEGEVLLHVHVNYSHISHVYTD